MILFLFLFLVFKFLTFILNSFVFVVKYKRNMNF